MLDGLAAREAAARGARLDRSVIERGREAARSGRVAAMIEADSAFHHLVYGASGNPLIAESTRPHWHHIQRAMGSVLQVAGAREQVWDEHQAILDAINAGDAARAERAARRALRGRRPVAFGPARASANRDSTHATQPNRGGTMKLTQEQLQQFDRDGYLFFPGLFSEPEIKALTDEVPALFAQRRPENVREKDSDAVRTNFAAHMYNRVFARLGRHPRMIEPVKQLFGEDVYMHQFKINGKVAFDGDLWQWHQDYGTWQADDQMPEARAMNIAIFLNEVNEFNGPLMFIPGSHKLGVVDADHDTTTTSYPLWTINHDTIRKLVAHGGLIAPKGPAGSMIVFHGCLVHGSTANLSPWDRWNVYLSLCAVSNHIRRFKRPAYIAHRDFTPIACLPDDCLLRDYDVSCRGRTARPRRR